VSVEENMALARRFLEARGKGDLDALEHMMALDFVDHTLAPSQAPNREGYKRQVAEYSAAFSNLRFVIEDQVAAGDKVVTRFTVSAPPTIEGSSWVLPLPAGSLPTWSSPSCASQKARSPRSGAWVRASQK
jgi:hypothetical protein